jgi:5'-nucleotidase
MALTLGALAIAFTATAAHAAGPATFRLTLLHNNDGESKLITPTTGVQANYGGIAHYVTLARQLESAVSGPGTGVVVVSSGDNFLAGPEFDASLTHGVPYYDALGLDAVGYDALAIGNHEFDFGPDVLQNWIQSFASGVPFVSANLDFTGEPGLQALVASGRIRKSTVVVRDGVSIGIVGATTPRLPYISSPRNVVVDPNVTAAVQAEVDALTLSGVKIIVFISHLQSIQEDLLLLPTLRGIDIAVAGGGSEVLANPGTPLVPGHAIFGPYPLNATDLDGRTVPVVTTEGDYFYVGRLTADFDADGELVAIDPALSGPVRVATPASGQPDAVAADAAVQAAVVNPVAAHVAALAAQVIGVTQVGIDGLRTRVRSVETNGGNLVADAMLWKARQLAPAFGVPLPTVALQNGGGIRNNSVIPVGNLTALNTFSILPFANYVCIVPAVPPAQFKEILENAVSRVEFGDGRFAQIAGFRFIWDPVGQPQLLDANGNVTQPGQRVLEATLADGTPIVASGIVMPGAPSLNVATIDFLANGGDQYPFRGAPFTSVGASYQQALSDYVQTGLGGLVTAAQYPSSGSGRIVRYDPTPTLDQDPPVITPVATPFSLRAYGSLDGRPRVDFGLPERTEVSLELFDVTGQRVARLATGSHKAGGYSLVWNGRTGAGHDAPAGMYFARLQAGDRVATSRFVLGR